MLIIHHSKNTDTLRTKNSAKNAKPRPVEGSANNGWQMAPPRKNRCRNARLSTSSSLLLIFETGQLFTSVIRSPAKVRTTTGGSLAMNVRRTSCVNVSFCWLELPPRRPLIPPVFLSPRLGKGETRSRAGRLAWLCLDALLGLALGVSAFGRLVSRVIIVSKSTDS